MARTARNTNAGVQALKKDLQALKGDFAQLVKHVEGTAGSAGNDLLNDVKLRLDNLSGSFEEAMSSAGAKGREAVDTVGEMGSDLLENAEEALHKRPFATLAIAVGVGFVLSSVLRSR